MKFRFSFSPQDLLAMGFNLLKQIPVPCINRKNVNQRLLAQLGDIETDPDNAMYITMAFIKGYIIFPLFIYYLKKKSDETTGPAAYGETQKQYETRMLTQRYCNKFKKTYNPFFMKKPKLPPKLESLKEKCLHGCNEHDHFLRSMWYEMWVRRNIDMGDQQNYGLRTGGGYHDTLTNTSCSEVVQSIESFYEEKYNVRLRRSHNSN